MNLERNEPKKINEESKNKKNEWDWDKKKKELTKKKRQ